MDVPFTSDKRAKKRARYSNAKGGDGDGKKGDNALPAPEPITSAKHLQQLLSITDSTALQHGFNSLRVFAGKCRGAGEDTNQAELENNRKILKEWLDAQIRRDSEGVLVEESFASITQAWSYASQTNSHGLLFHLPTSVYALIKTVSEIREWIQVGTYLCRAIIQPAILRQIQKCIAGGRDKVVSPCLRVLTEINRFNGGALCSQLYSNFDFSFKDIGKGLEVKRSEVQLTYDPYRQTTRTVFVRFILSFFQFGSTQMCSEMLNVKAFMSPLFKHLKNDAPPVIGDVLEILDKKVLQDKEIPRNVKTLVFNEWVLGNIGVLYSRDQVIRDIAGKAQTVATAAHEFLLAIATKPGQGVCFKDSGWYPKNVIDEEESAEGEVKLYNRILSSFIKGLKPYSDTLQQDLLLAIFKACPELVADYFGYEHLFSFEPKATVTWIGYTAFLASVTQLPIPTDYGVKGRELPPPASTVIESIIPRPLNRVVLQKCLQHENALIKFSAVRLLIFTFKKLVKVLKSLDETIESVVEKQPWEDLKEELVEEHFLRIPELPIVVSQYNGTSDKHALLKEALARSIQHYYQVHPLIAFSSKFDVNISLGAFLSRPDSGLETPISLLELSKLLTVAEDLPDVRWWNKPATMKFAPFIYLLRLYILAPPSAPLTTIRSVLEAIIEPTLLFQTETFGNPLDALLDSLHHAKNSPAFEPILLFLENCAHRLIRGANKYFDEYMRLAWESARETYEGPIPEDEVVYVKPVSGLVMTLVEQWKFFAKSEHSKDIKRSTAAWLVKLLEALILINENERVIAKLVDVLIADSEEISATRLVFRAYKLELTGIIGGGISQTDMEGEEQVETDITAQTLRSWIRKKGVLNLKENYRDVLKHVETGEIPVTVFDVSYIQRIIPRLLKKADGDGSDLAEILFQFMWTILPTVLERISGRWSQNFRKWLVTDSAWLDIFLKPSIKVKGDIDARDFIATFTHGFAKIICICYKAADEVLAGVYEKIVDSAKKGFTLRPEVTTRICEIIEANSSAQQVLQIASTLKESIKVTLKPTSSEVSGYWTVLASLFNRSHTLGIDNLPESLPSIHAAIAARGNPNDEFCIALISYVKKFPKAIGHCNLSDEAMEVLLHNGLNSPFAASLIAFIVKKRNDSRTMMLQHLSDSNVCNCSTEDALPSHYMSALLEAYSTGVSAHESTWDATVKEAEKEELRLIFDKVKEQLISELPAPGPATALCRAVKLFPTLDKSFIHGGVSRRKKKGSFSPEMVSLVDALLQAENADIGNASWLLLAVDHLTRSFAEQEDLNPKAVEFCEQLEKLLQRNKSATSMIPRAALNAMLEAAFEKHLQVLQVVKLTARLVSQATAKLLDLSKLLSIILGNRYNPLLFSTIEDRSEIRYYVAYLIHRLFSFSKASQATVTTWDGVLVLYGGSNDLADRALLDIIQYIEAYLSRSVASRISEWLIIGGAEDGEVRTISRTKGQIKVSINPRVLQRSITKFITEPHIASTEVYNDLDKFIGISDLVRANNAEQPTVYDPAFMLPVLTYLLISKEQLLDVQTAIEKYCLGYALTHLSSLNPKIRSMAKSFLLAFAAKAESTPSYREATQITHFTSAVLASLDILPKSLESAPLPSVVAIYLARVAGIVSNPTHFLYEPTMEMLMAGPTLHLSDLPRALNPLEIKENTHKTLDWVVGVLSAGVRTRADVSLYVKRNVFQDLMVIYISAYTPAYIRERIFSLFWSVCIIRGASTTLLTRLGMLTWIRMQVAHLNASGTRDKEGSAERKLDMKRLAMRLWETSDKDAVRRWSAGMVAGWLRDFLLDAEGTNSVFLEMVELEKGFEDLEMENV